MLTFLLLAVVKSELVGKYDQEEGRMHFYETKENGIKDDLGAFIALPRPRRLISGSNLWINDEKSVCIRTCVGCRELYPSYTALSDCTHAMAKNSQRTRRFH